MIGSVLVSDGSAMTVPSYSGPPSLPTTGTSIGQRPVRPLVSAAVTYQRTICPGVEAEAGIVAP